MRKFNCIVETDSLEVDNSVIRASVSVVAPLLFDELPSTVDRPCTVIRDISYISENLSKFQNMSDIQQMAIVERLRDRGSSQFDKLSDEELLSVVKPRFVQLPAEVNAYLNYINNNIDQLIHDAAVAASVKDNVSVDSAKLEDASEIDVVS